MTNEQSAFKVEKLSNVECLKYIFFLRDAQRWTSITVLYKRKLREGPTPYGFSDLPTALHI